MAFRLVLWHGIRTGQCPKKEETTMTKENAKELRMDLAKDALALLMLHEELDVRSHRECMNDAEDHCHRQPYQ